MKRYYEIDELSELFKHPTYIFRMWDKKFGQLASKRGRKNQRQYTVEDLEKINKIYFYRYVKGYNLSHIKKHIIL